jgi:hypothetical protein
VKGTCVLTIPEIAARSGTSETTVRRALKEASRQGMVTVEERRVPYRKNLPNVVRVVSAEWLMWIKRSSGCQKRKPTESKGFQEKRNVSRAEGKLSVANSSARGLLWLSWESRLRRAAEGQGQFGTAPGRDS